jgi:hypothetical protein
MDRDEAQSLLQQAAEGLGEFFDNVVVSATWTEDGKGTDIQHCWSGDYFAARGMADDFLAEESFRKNDETQPDE